MISFQKLSSPIPASRRRIISLWFGDVDRIQLFTTQNFTGSAILATVYALTGTFQYYLVFLSLSQKIVETWTTEPEKIALSETSNFEKNLIAELKNKGIGLSAIQPSTQMFNKTLSKLPMAYNDDNDTMPAGIFDPKPITSSSSTSLSKEDRNTLLNLLSKA